MQKWIMFIVFSAASLLAVYLLTAGLPEKPVDESAALPEGTTLLKVEASNDFVFDQEEYKVKAGETVRMVLKNTSGIHGLAIQDLGVELTAEANQVDIEIKPEQAGKVYEMVCSIPCGAGHTTMKAKLVVEAA
ncbi:cytochrome C oxidase subunit II [Paenibacillus sp. GCM10023252]|uniref:cytochrome C oxidase subunit II n=1 Tax=Paenibacillus sp. GCM10023252 TaxID=3252649 RepID=UPI00360F7129